MSYRFSNYWQKAYPSTKKPGERFWVCLIDLTDDDENKYKLKFTKVDSATNWMTELTVGDTNVVIKQSNHVRSKLLNDAQEFVRQTRAKNRPISNKPTITNKEVSKEENCM
jgi:hypothetical protein